MRKNLFIVVHAGRRDDYQVALALNETDMLHCLVTDFYAPFDKWYGHLLNKNKRLSTILSKRYKKGLDSSKVVVSYKAIFYSILYLLTKKIKYSRLKDKALGRKANKISRRRKIPVISMNTYACFAFAKNENEPKILYQFHPHAKFVKDILEEEMIIYPQAEESISKEYEFSLSDRDLKNLITESEIADHILCASSITKRSLLLEGINENKITVIPYGVDQDKFPYLERKGYTKAGGSNFRVLFVGSLNQRKGIIYLLDALSSIENIELEIVGRGIFDEGLLVESNVMYTIHKDIALSKLVELMHSSHCLVLPSIIEGFGQVILEAMSTGLPVIASCNTVAIDIIKENNGFVVPIRDSNEIRKCIIKLMSNPEMYERISVQSYHTSKSLSWDRFRKEIANKVKTLSNI